MWAPYLLGERTPHLDPQVRAAFAGISTIHTAAHFTRAVLEGVAYSLRDTFTLFAELGIPVSAVRLGGGERAVRCGAKFRLAFMGRRSKYSRPKKAGRSVAR